MCGIAGFIATGSSYDGRAVVRRMVATLRHRGPDDEGEYVDEQAVLGACRLSIIDLAGGRQPIANETGTVHAVLNGEIYNFRRLRARLEQRGHRFATQSDTEVLVHAYEQDGEDFVADLDGMFALALWDAPARKLVLARDRMGEKPLYYYDGPGVLVFGSELRALLEHPAVPRALDPRSLARYLLFDAVPAPYSMLDGIAKLPPGHTLVVSPGAKPNVTAYWALAFAPDDRLGEAQWRERLIGQLEASVVSRLGADVPVGVFVSGGIDSGAVTAFAARHATSAPLRTFALGFDTPSYDERGFARIVAAQFGTEHHELLFTPADALALMERVGGLLDEPLGDASFLPKYALARAARGSVKVALSGDGGDELFCGYPTFLAEVRQRRLLAEAVHARAALSGRRADPAAARRHHHDRAGESAVPERAPRRRRLRCLCGAHHLSRAGCASRSRRAPDPSPCPVLSGGPDPGHHGPRDHGGRPRSPRAVSRSDPRRAGDDDPELAQAARTLHEVHLEAGAGRHPAGGRGASTQARARRSDGGVAAWATAPRHGVTPHSAESTWPRRVRHGRAARLRARRRSP